MRFRCQHKQEVCAAHLLSSRLRTSRDASLSVPEFHTGLRRKKALADYTADREFHPALKTSHSVVLGVLYHAAREMQERIFETPVRIPLTSGRGYTTMEHEKGGEAHGPRAHLLFYRPPAGKAALGRRRERPPLRRAEKAAGVRAGGGLPAGVPAFHLRHGPGDRPLFLRGGPGPAGRPAGGHGGGRHPL